MTRPTHMLTDGSFVWPDGYDPADLTPLPAGYWDAADFERARADKWAMVRAIRDRLIDAGLHVDGIGTFDSDAAARQNVLGAASAAMIAQAGGAEFSVVWTLRDNSRATLDAAQIIAVQIAGVTRIDALHGHAADLRVLIQSATDVTSLAAIDIDGGWPEF